MKKTQVIQVTVKRYYKGHRGNLTYVSGGPRSATTKIMMRAPTTLDGIAKTLAVALGTTPRHVLFGLRTVGDGSVVMEAIPTRLVKEGRPAIAEVWSIRSPLPRRLKIGQFFDSPSGLPEALEDSPCHLTVGEITDALRAAAVPESARWEYRKRRPTDHDRRIRISMRFMKIATRKRNPPSIAVLRRALSAAS